VGFLDMIVRSGKEEAIDPADFREADRTVLSELRDLGNLYIQKRVRPTAYCYLAPHLAGDWLTSGAYPDLAVDGWMCELKVISRMADSVKWVDQIVLYLALASLAGFKFARRDYWTASYESSSPGRSSLLDYTPDPLPRFLGLAVYFARHGEWVTVPVQEILLPRQLEEVQTLICANYLKSTSARKAAKLRRDIHQDALRLKALGYQNYAPI
jgi:hypothetical protein